MISLAKKARHAHKVREEIRQLQHHIGLYSMELIIRLKEMRDKKYYKDLGYEKFEQYLSEENFAPSTVHNYIGYWETWQEFKSLSPVEVSDTDFANIGVKRLSVVGKSLLTNPQLIHLLLTGSLRDLINETRRVRGKPEMIKTNNPPSGEATMHPLTYSEMVKDAHCILCDDYPCDLHHFPHGRNRTNDQRKVIPLCRACHSEFHSTPWSQWCALYGRKVFNWMMELLLSGEK